MTPEEARARFDQALDGELEGADLTSFQQALDADPALRSEYEALVAVREGLDRLGRDGARPPVDLLPGLQARLRQRSGGRFYRDRFSERLGTRGLSVFLLVCCAVLLAGALWLAAGALLPDVPR